MFTVYVGEELHYALRTCRQNGFCGISYAKETCFPGRIRRPRLCPGRRSKLDYQVHGCVSTWPVRKSVCADDKPMRRSLL